MKKPVLVLGALLLALTSCGTGDEETAAESLRAEITANSTMAGGASVTDDEAGCIADGTVEEVGVQQLKKYQILTDDLKVNQGIENVEMSASDAEALAAVFVDCIDVEALFEEQFTEGAGAAADLSAKQKDCIADAVTEDEVAKVLAASFQGKQNDAYADLQKQMMECALDAK